MALAVGDRVSDVSGARTGGGTLSVAEEVKSRPLVIHFFPKAFTGG